MFILKFLAETILFVIQAILMFIMAPLLIALIPLGYLFDLFNFIRYKITGKQYQKFILTSE